MEKIRKTIVIKIGSSILMTQRNKLDESRIDHIADQVASLRAEGVGVILVVSGAVACGHKFISFSKDQRHFRQAAAGLGQAILTATFNNIFNQKEMQIAQVLLTKDSFDSSINKEKIKTLLEFYIQSGFTALINENDVLDLNSFGGNDHLAGEIADLISADRLLLLSTYEKSLFGVGGGVTKQKVINFMKTKNIQTEILDGKTNDVILSTIL